MPSRQRGLIIGGVLLAGVLLWIFYEQVVSPTPRIRNLSGDRSHEIDRSRIETMDLYLNGMPYGSQVHEVKLGEQFEWTGHLPLNRTMIPTGLFVSRLVVSHYPIGTEESQWSVHNPLREWRLSVKGLQGEVDESELISSESFSPGDYQLRIYLMIRDSEGENDAFDYLGSAQLKVLPK